MRIIDLSKPKTGDVYRFRIGRNHVRYRLNWHDGTVQFESSKAFAKLKRRKTIIIQNEV
jgi:hypothetical protein